MKFCHLFHSTVTLETDTHFFLFDWFRGDAAFPNDKKTVAIATHGHGDHFSEALFSILPEDATVLLSDDIETAHPHQTLAKDQVYEMDSFKITTFGSTDQGISLLLETHGGSFFFAGDLNAWIWPEDDEETQTKERDDFLHEVDKISRFPVDVAFVPADPRLEENFAEGVRLFDERVQPRAIAPIHFQDDFDTAKRLQEALPHAPIIQLKGPGDCVTL